jgi:SAM-dependent methyltransferase
MAEEIGSEEEFWERIQPYMFSEEKLESAPEDVEEVLELVDTEPEKILDMPCGVGRHSIELAERGFDVTGVDATSAYIDSAKEALEESDAEVEFIENDMRDFSREESFDLALNLWNSFGYFRDDGDNREVLENFFSSLKPGGALVMQVLGKEVIESGKHWQEQDGTYLLEEYRIAEDYTWMENRWVLIENGEITEYSPSYRIYSAEELKEILKDVGFGSVEVFGGLDGSSYDDSSEYLVVVARKAQES